MGFFTCSRVTELILIFFLVVLAVASSNSDGWISYVRQWRVIERESACANIRISSLFDSTRLRYVYDTLDRISMRSSCKLYSALQTDVFDFH